MSTKACFWLSVLQSYKWPALILCASSMHKSFQSGTLIVTKLYEVESTPILQIWTYETGRLNNISNSLQLLNDEAKIQI